MQSFVIHSVVSQKINKFYNYDEQLFMIGNIMADCWRNTPEYLEGRNKSHFQPKGEDTVDEDYMAFYNKYKTKLNNPVYMGYLIHLLTDIYWRNYVIPNYFVYSDDKKYIRLDNGSLVSTDNLSKFYYDEAHKLDHYFLNKYKINEFPEVASYHQIDNFECDIDELNLCGLPKTFEYANSVIRNSHEDESILFNQGDLENRIDDMVMSIYNKINEIEKEKHDNKIKSL